MLDGEPRFTLVEGGARGVEVVLVDDARRVLADDGKPALLLQSGQPGRRYEVGDVGLARGDGADPGGVLRQEGDDQAVQPGRALEPANKYLDHLLDVKRLAIGGQGDTDQR